MSAPLTIEQARVLAAQWVDHERNEWDKALDAAETDALRGWVRRRMAAAHDPRPAAGADVAKAVWLLDVGDALGLPLADAGTLCEWAGWPS